MSSSQEVPGAQNTHKPSAIPVTCRLEYGDRHFSSGGVLGYHSYWRVTDGPEAGRLLERVLWDTPNGRTQADRDCRVLGLRHPDELCLAQDRELRVRGGLVIDGSGKACLGWIEKVLSCDLPPKGSTGSTEPLPF